MKFLFTPTPHEEAVAFIAEKPVVSREVFQQLLPELRARAFAISGIESATVVQQVRDTLATLPAGARWEDVKKSLVEDIHPYLASAEDPDNTAAAENRAELLLRTHGFQAYQAASYRVMDRQRAAFPAWQYLSMQDGRVRPTHQALDGMVLPADSDFWKTHFPPWEWGCRCQVVPLSQEDVDAIAKEDADRPEERKLIPTGVRLEQIEKNERMLRGGQTIDLRSPVNKGKPGAFSWNPADLRLPLDELRKRYDAPVWAAFESMARKSTPLGSTTTLWDWLNGSPVVPAPAGKPAPAPSKDEEAAWTALLAKAGVTGKATGWTLKEATRFVKGLQQPLPLEVDDVLALDILNAPTKGPLAKRAVRRHLSHFVRMLPPTLGSGLPKLRVIIAPLPATTGGEYHPGEKAIYLNRLLPNTREVRRVLYHEAMHWVHMEGSADYQARVAAHFAARTRGESIVALPRYSGVVGKLDRWYEAYAGTIYPGAPFDSADGLGVEVPTRYMELVADPRRLSAQLHPNMPHSAHVMETLRIILAPFLQ